ncbi:unnamed protein product [Cyprideis torosa]|uniref:Uncharacterized protein n=1 Tax=Cyprideis torosa TaxID=163714 RepID=A0A7R8WAM9_9CRUS|nr:unnamed protein product [Cyprideis torosa]CAG0886011.1 unnamed protein product [Cyprideis torosa]
MEDYSSNVLKIGRCLGNFCVENDVMVESVLKQDMVGGGLKEDVMVEGVLNEDDLIQGAVKEDATVQCVLQEDASVHISVEKELKFCVPSEEIKSSDENVSVPVDFEKSVLNVCDKNKIREQDAVELEQVPNRIKCPVCQKTFSSSQTLAQHVRIHTGERRYVCNVCEQRFSEFGTLQTHERVHSGERPFECPICSQTFSDHSSLWRHKKLHDLSTPSELFDCAVCKRQFNRRDHLSRHLQGHLAKKSYVCNVCSKHFADGSSLRRHELLHSGIRPFQCNQCSKTFVESGALKVHQRTHSKEKPFSCEVCNRAFTHSSNLNKHRKTHTPQKERSFACGPCNKSYVSEKTLKAHEKAVHGKQHHKTPPGEVVGTCDICGATFMSKHSLILHTRYVHSTDLPFVCLTCGKRCKTKALLYSHERTHTGEGRKVCQICGKSQYYLKKHMRVHTGERPYTCDTCGMGFKGKSDMYRHQVVHTGARPYACNVPGCGKTFKQSGILKRHKDDKHPGWKDLYPSKPFQKYHRRGQPWTPKHPKKCSLCGKQVKCLKMHLRFHEKQELKKHVSITSDAKLFTCEDCGKPFQTPGELNSHKNCHSGERTLDDKRSEDTKKDGDGAKTKGPDSETLVTNGGLRMEDTSFTEDANLLGDPESSSGIEKRPRSHRRRSRRPWTHSDDFVWGTNDELEISDVELDDRDLPTDMVSVDGAPFINESCGQTFKVRGELNGQKKSQPYDTKEKNVKTVHTPNGPKPYACGYCWKRFFCKYSLKKHERNIHQAKNGKREVKPPISCDICGAKYITKNSMTLHSSRHSDVAPFVCRSCGKAFKTSDELDLHSKIHTRERKPCTICGVHFLNLQHHIRTKHKYVSDEPVGTCDICGATFMSKHSLILHTRYVHSTDLPFVCLTCGKRCKTKALLYSHERTHTGEGRKVCQICGKSQYYLKKHMRVHTGERPYTCDTCGMGFKGKSDMYRHQVVHTGARPYACNVPGCGKTFKQSGILKRHKDDKHPGWKDLYPSKSVHKYYKRGRCWTPKKPANVSPPGTIDSTKQQMESVEVTT